MWEVFEQLLQERGLTVYQVCKELHISNGTIGNWKRRKGIVGSDIGMRIAQFFGVTFEYLVTGDESKRYYASDKTAIEAQKAFEKYRILFDSAEGNTEENIQMAAELLNKLKGSNPDG